LVPIVALLFLVGSSIAGAEDSNSKDRQVAEMILLHQRESGGWPKNYDRNLELNKPLKEKLLRQKSRTDTTFDNGATHSELVLLAKAYQATGDARFRMAFLNGLDFIFRAQYRNGGWPQFYPEPGGYQVHITFNDDAMVGLLRLLKAVAQGDEPYGFVDETLRSQCEEAVDRGVDCILGCQIEVEGRKTAWCAQHDAKTLVPQRARSYELPSISGSESVGIVRFLMGIEPPNAQIIEAVQSAITWFQDARIDGIRVERKEDPSTPKGYDKVVVEDLSAPPLWARFYEIGTNEPMFCSRDGIPRETLAEISYERRNGYSWYSSRALRLLTREYPAWQAKWAPNDNVLVGSEFAGE